MNSGVCAACGTLTTNVYPWWFYVGLTVCLAIVIAELALINWTRFIARQRRFSHNDPARQ